MKKPSNYCSHKSEVLAALAIWLFAIVSAFSMSENSQSTEFWPPIFGYQLKITDTLVALFTFGLFVATALLWRATKKLVDGAQETAERQLRAYVSVKEIVMEQLRHRPQYGLQGEVQQGAIHSYRIFVMLENTGQTPTRHARVNINWQIRPDKLPSTFDYPNGETELAVIGARSVFGSPGFFVSIADVGTVAAKERKLFLWGWVEYDDVFKVTPRHRTEFCFEMIADELPNEGNISMRFPNSGLYNAIDADCTRLPQAKPE